MALDALYKHRFKDVDQQLREAVWREIAAYLYRVLGCPDRILDPACGRGEFINAVRSPTRWAIDIEDMADHLDPRVRFMQEDTLEALLPERYFDGILVSNFLEHLPMFTVIHDFLVNMRESLLETGRIAIMGPNFRYAWREYYDCADHERALTHIAVEEHLAMAGFKIEASIPRFLPYSFRQRLPASPLLVRWYLRAPVLWPVFGKQFLVIGVKA